MFKPLVVLSALVLGSASFAHADSIYGTFNVGGTDTFTASAPYTLSILGAHVQGTVTGNLANYVSGGSIDGSVLGTPVVFENPIPYSPTGASITPPAPIPVATIMGSGGNTFTFNVVNYAASLINNGTQSCASGSICLTLTGNGFITETGPANLTPSGAGAFTLTTQYSNGEAVGTNVTTFSVSGGVPPAVTPEPSSLALLGTGMFGIVGLARRKFNV